MPLVVHYSADLQSVHGFRCYDNIAPNAKYQRVLCSVLVVRLVLCATKSFIWFCAALALDPGDATESLLEAGAPVNATDVDGNTTLYVVVFKPPETPAGDAMIDLSRPIC